MTKKEKLDEIFSTLQEDPSENLSREELIPEDIEISPSEIPKNVFILANFSNAIVEIGYIFLATNEQNIITASNGRINLLQGRMYYIPINNQIINSDQFNIKIHSDVADRVDIRFVKDGFACVVPIRHNVILKTGEKLCELIPF
jgi:hypothetical protein